MVIMDFKNILYNQHHTRESLLPGLGSVLDSEHAHLTIIPFACDKKVTECFPASAPHRVFDTLSCNEEVALFKLRFYPLKLENDSSPVDGKFYVIPHTSFQNIFLVLTLEPIDFLRRALIPFIEHNSSSFYLTFLKHDYLHTLLKQYQNFRVFTDLTVTRASHVNRFDAEKGESRIPTVSWPGLPLEAAFSYAQEQNAWFKSITFEVRVNKRLISEVTVHRNGIIKTNGDFKTIYENLALPICDLIYQNIKMFERRSRRDNPELDVSPLVIQFGRDQFNDVSENARFISAIQKLNNASVSVLHGNPYISISVVDYFDGSTFDLWVLNTSELVIIPQLTSTVSAMKRLISCVFDNYSEGNIRDFRMPN